MKSRKPKNFYRGPAVMDRNDLAFPLCLYFCLMVVVAIFGFCLGAR